MRTHRGASEVGTDMTISRATPALLLVLVFLGGAWLAPAAEGSAPHLRLLSSSPQADTVVGTAPAEIRLVFSEPPQMRGTTVRLVNASEELVATSSAAADPEDARQVFIRPESTLPAGSYTVMWRVIAQDGHTQRGDFDFSVGSTDRE
ncbi:MAG: copper resistance protein CopC [Gemmatimonadales bacterium]|nr:MAG: copper resistance protein CopC [Gemmatimonadales bacterium]